VNERDIAAVAVAALTGAGHDRQTYAITRPAALTFTEVAATLTAAAGHIFTYVPASEAAFAQRLSQCGLPTAVATDLAKEYTLIGAGQSAFGIVTGTVPRLTGQPARSVDQFARDYARMRCMPSQISATAPNATQTLIAVQSSSSGRVAYCCPTINALDEMVACIRIESTSSPACAHTPT